MPPLSTSGTVLVPPSRPMTMLPRENVSARKMRELEARINALESHKDPGSLAWWASRIHLAAFVQPQFIAQFFNGAASPNPPGIGANDTFALASGDTTNAIFFRMRRARLRLDADLAQWKSGIPMVRLVFEMEPLP